HGVLARQYAWQPLGRVEVEPTVAVVVADADRKAVVHAAVVHREVARVSLLDEIGRTGLGQRVAVKPQATGIVDCADVEIEITITVDIDPRGPAAAEIMRQPTRRSDILECRLATVAKAVAKQRAGTDESRQIDVGPAIVIEVTDRRACGLQDHLAR